MVWWCRGSVVVVVALWWWLWVIQSTGAQTTVKPLFGSRQLGTFENLKIIVISIKKQWIIILNNSPRAQTTRYALFGPDIVVVIFLDGSSSSPSCNCKQILVLVFLKKKKKCTKGSRCVASRALAPVVTFPCYWPSGGVVTWQSVDVWVVGGGTCRGGVVSVLCGVSSLRTQTTRRLGPFVLKSIKESIEHGKYIWRNTNK